MKTNEQTNKQRRVSPDKGNGWPQGRCGRNDRQKYLSQICFTG
jgi:hypothetical protein